MQSLCCWQGMLAELRLQERAILARMAIRRQPMRGIAMGPDGTPKIEVTMPFQNDPRMAEQSGREFGQYLITFISEQGQVRADFFRRGKIVTAHTSFPTGLDASTVKDSYYVAVWNYAREHGFADQFQIVYLDQVSR